jgi:GNAT superfamily N-acetyltransferase
MIEVRMATYDDIDALIKMRFDFSCEHDESITLDDYPEFELRCREFLKSALSSNSNWRIWVAEVDARVVAHMFVQLVEKVPRPGKVSPPFGYVTNVYTLPSYRTQKIGSKIHDEIAKWAREEKWDFLIVWPSDNSVTFYERNGFSKCKEAMEWFWS